MSYKISKELFETVYNCDITTDKDMLGVYKRINIHEFAHKCKEWAWEKHRYKLKSGIYIGSKTDITESEYVCTDYEEIVETANTEPQAVFQACQWILDNKEN